jgi:hypothetical protein
VCGRSFRVAEDRKRQEVRITVRDTTLLNQLLGLPGIAVRGVSLPWPGGVVVEVALRRQRLECPECGWSTRARYDRRPVASRWRHLDVGR